MIAIELANEDESGSYLCINPGDRKYVEFGTRGFFVAGSAEEAKRAYFFCEVCHKDIVNLEQIKKCKCQTGMLFIKLNKPLNFTLHVFILS